MSEDITHILLNWEYDPENTSRIIKAGNGREILQVRQPLGIEQYELSGRPDGLRPHGMESYLDWFTKRLAKYKQVHETDDGFSISHEDFIRLQNEGIIYYYRYLVLFQMSDFARTTEDTDHNLKICDLMDKYCENPKDKKEMLQYRPYILRINAIAKAMLSLNQHLKSAATQILESAIKLIQSMPNIETPAFQIEKLRSLLSLRTTLKEIIGQEISPVTQLKKEMEAAVETEHYERAAELRDKINEIEIEERLHDDM